MERIFCNARKNNLDKSKIEIEIDNELEILRFENGGKKKECFPTVCSCASLKSPFSIARIISHLAISMARCDFILPSSNSNVTSVNAHVPINFSKFFFTSYPKNRKKTHIKFKFKILDKLIKLLPISNFEHYHFVLPVVVKKC